MPVTIRVLGFAETVSWSYSRAKSRAGCLRAYFWQYFAKGEPEVRQANMLKKLVTIDMLAGQSVDWAIGTALNAYRQDKDSLTGLVDRGTSVFRRLVASSRATCDGIKKGRFPAHDSQPLFHDYYDQTLSKGKVERCESRVVDCLTNFVASETLDRILSVDPDDWNPPKSDSVPYFRIPKGPTVYANYDMYLRPGIGQLVILDWKTGKVTKETCDQATEQLAVYALFGVYALKAVPQQVEVMAAWLRTSVPWSPEHVSFERQKAAHDRILADWKEETASLKFDTGGRKQPSYVADRNDFPPDPTPDRCLSCKFRELCPEGLALTSPVDCEA